MVQAYFERAPWRDYVDSLTEIYRDRRDAMLDALATYLPPGCTWTVPDAARHDGGQLPALISTDSVGSPRPVSYTG